MEVMGLILIFFLTTHTGRWSLMLESKVPEVRSVGLFVKTRSTMVSEYRGLVFSLIIWVILNLLSMSFKIFLFGVALA